MCVAGRWKLPDLPTIKFPLHHPGYCRYQPKKYVQIITHGFDYEVQLFVLKCFPPKHARKSTIAYQTQLEYRRQKEKCQRQDAVYSQQH